MTGKKVKITDTIFRDAHQSLLATRMKTRDMLPIASQLDKVGFFSLEVWGGATFDVCLRFLREDPWERLRALKEAIKNTPLQMLLRGQNLVGYRHCPDDVVEKFIYKAKENGIDIFRIFDALNDIRNMEKAITIAKKAGAVVEGAISYTISPVHTIEQFVTMVKQLEELGCDIICIKDMAGLISPAEAYNLIKKLKQETRLPVNLHSHSTSGVAPISYFAACEAGVDILDTAISPLAGGTSQPATETIVGALKNTPYDTGLDLKLLNKIRNYFLDVVERYRKFLDPISLRVDPTILLHQIPGGMLSNLISQLKEQNALEKYDDVLKETARVREELGWPPLVTPTSQIVAAQAVINVITGERYKVIIKEVKDYIRGLYGRPPAPINPEVKRKAIGNEEPISCRPADLIPPELNKPRNEVKNYLRTEEDTLCYILFPQTSLEFFKFRDGELKDNHKKEALQPVEIIPEGKEGSYLLKLNDKQIKAEISPQNHTLTISIDESKYKIMAEHAFRFILSGKSPPLKKTQQEEKKPAITTSGRGVVKPPMPGKIVRILKNVGEKVEEGEPVIILESMKMENEISSPTPGVIKNVNVKPGQKVSLNDILFIIE